MSILHRCDLWLLGEEPDHAAGARIAWVERPPAGSGFRLYAPRLANPHPGRDVAGIAFEASEHFASGPMVFAATIEQADRAPQPAGGE